MVIAIIGILAAIIIVTLQGAKDRARYATLSLDARNIANGIKVYEAAGGTFTRDPGMGFPNDLIVPGLSTYFPNGWNNPPCSEWVFDWDIWPDPYLGCSELTPGGPGWISACEVPNTQRVSIRKLGDDPDTKARFFYCISSEDPTGKCLGEDFANPGIWGAINNKEPKTGGGFNISNYPPKAITCNE